MQKPILIAKPHQNNFFADVVQASQGGLSSYQSQPKQNQQAVQQRKSTSSNNQGMSSSQQPVTYDAYNKLMQQLIKESGKKPMSKQSYRKASASSRTRTKS